MLTEKEYKESSNKNEKLSKRINQINNIYSQTIPKKVAEQLNLLYFKKIFG